MRRPDTFLLFTPLAFEHTKPQAYYYRIVDVMEKLMMLTLLTRVESPNLFDLYSESMASGGALSVEAAGRGLVPREPNPSDARSWLVTLTVEGVRRADELNASLDAYASQPFDCHSEYYRVAVEKSLKLLLKALRQYQAASCCASPAPPTGGGPCC